MINFALEDGRGSFWAVFKNRMATEFSGGKDSILHRLEFTEDPEGDWWGWQDTDSQDFNMIFDSKPQFYVCFPHGPEAEVARGRGRIVRLKMKDLGVVERESK